MPSMNPGRVTRTAIVFGSWQSTQAIGCWIRGCPAASRIARASSYGIPETFSKPLWTSPSPATR